MIVQHTQLYRYSTRFSTLVKFNSQANLHKMIENSSWTIPDYLLYEEKKPRYTCTTKTS